MASAGCIKPNEAMRREILTECMRLLDICNAKGARAMLADLDDQTAAVPHTSAMSLLAGASSIFLAADDSPSSSSTHALVSDRDSQIVENQATGEAASEIAAVDSSAVSNTGDVFPATTAD